MRSVLVTMLIISTLFLSQTTFAKSEYTIKYTTNISSEITGEQALLASLNGKTVYKCQTAEFKMGKSGTSGSLRNVKKPKSDADTKTAIKELEEQLGK